MTTPLPRLLMTAPGPHVIGGEELQRLVAVEVINRLNRYAISMQAMSVSSTRLAIAGMLTTTARLTAAPGYERITAAVCTAGAAFTICNWDALPAALEAVDEAVAARYCTEVKDLEVNDWIADHARPIVTRFLAAPQQ